MLVIIIILFLSVYIVFWMINYFRLYFPLLEYEKYINITFWFLFLVLGLIIVILIVKYLQYYNSKTKLEELEKFETMRKNQKISIEQQLELEKNNQEYIKKQLHDIKRLVESNRIDEAKKAFSTVYSNFQMNSNKSMRYCSNTYINAVLYNKLNIAKEHGINIKYNILLPEKDSINVIDLPTILFNILDNSINACTLILHSNKYINLDINYNADYITIYLKNSIGKVIKDNNHQLDHGYGLEIVESIARKYDGHCVWENKGDYFESKIILRYNLNDRSKDEYSNS